MIIRSKAISYLKVGYLLHIMTLLEIALLIFIFRSCKIGGWLMDGNLFLKMTLLLPFAIAPFFPQFDAYSRFQNYKLIKDSKQGILRIYLRYMKSGNPALLGLRRISKPGLRIYKKADALPKVYGGLGIAIISTSSGLLTDNEAREKKIGGEIICYVW